MELNYKKTVTRISFLHQILNKVTFSMSQNINFSLAVFFSADNFAGCKYQHRPQQRDDFLMNTFVTVP